jgi:hypothetical protein
MPWAFQPLAELITGMECQLMETIRELIWRPRPELNWCKRFCRPLRNHSATWPQLKIAVADQGVASISFVLLDPRQTHETRTKTVRVPPQLPPVFSQAIILMDRMGQWRRRGFPLRLIGGNEDQAHQTRKLSRSAGASRFAFRRKGRPGSSIGMMYQDTDCSLNWSTAALPRRRRSPWRGPSNASSTRTSRLRALLGHRLDACQAAAPALTPVMQWPTFIATEVPGHGLV